MNKLTNEQIQEILDGAPEGATHVDYFEADPMYLKMDGCKWNQYDGEEWFYAEEEELRLYFDFHNLDDLREMLELRQEVERLKAEAIKLLDATICPCCDKSGAYYDNHGEVCQCQWCDEVNKLREQSDE